MFLSLLGVGHARVCVFSKGENGGRNRRGRRMEDRVVWDVFPRPAHNKGLSF